MALIDACRKGTRWVHDHLFFGLVLIAGPLVFLFVPQVFNLWYSQNPPLSSPSTWLLLWLAFIVFLAAGLLFFGVSVYLVPSPLTRRPRLGWTNERGATKKLMRLVGWVFGIAAVVIDWVVTRPAACIDKLHRWLRLALGLVVIGVSAALLVLGPSGTSSGFYVLSGAFIHNFGWWLVLMGIWIAVCGICLPAGGSLLDQLESGDARHPVLILGGRLLAWLTASMLVAELLWIGANSPLTDSVVSYRASTLWLLLHLWGVAAVVASCLDFLDRHVQVAPVRLVAAVVVATLALVIRPGSNADVRLLPESTDKPALAYDGYDQLEARIRSIPEGQPVMLVAASGGGSRAAVFSSLVLEFLARRPLESPDTGSEQPVRYWSDNIVLISSVSGGSLATGHFVKRGCKSSPLLDEPRFSILRELVYRVGRNIDELDKLGPLRGKVDPDFERAQQRAAKVKESLSGSSSDPKHSDTWIVRSQFVDDMCLNFMAPILRGANSAGLYRGDALARFWDDYYKWDDCGNLSGFQSVESNPPALRVASPDVPLVIFNACDVGKGSRIAIGFPPLPVDAFAANLTDPTRPAPIELARLYAPAVTEISLSKAVRLSSNFPWGFHASTLDGQVEVDGTRRSVRTLVLDGGVSDNTGIDTIYELIRGLGNTPRGQNILRLLQDRQVVLLEIDSGAKPTPPTMVDRILGAALEPVQALNNASYTNADQAKEHYLSHLKELLTPAVRCDDPEATAEQIEVHNNRPANVFQVTVRCNHFSLERPDQRAVMTAWALGPDDKANVMARFAFELSKVEASLQEVEKARPDFVQARQLADSLQPEAAEERLSQEVEASREFAQRLDPILDQVPNQLNAEQQLALEKAVVPYANAAQQVASTAESRDLPGKLPGKLSTPQLQEWARDYERKLQTKVPGATRAATKAVRTVAPVAAPDRAATLQALREATQNLKKKQDTVQRMTNQSRDWFEKPKK